MAKKTTPGFEETNEDIVMGLADAQTQITSVETLVNEWKKAGESTPKNVICWTEPWVWIVPARDGFTSLSALQAIETVNRLLQTWHPPKGYQAKEVRVLQNVGNLLFCLTTPDHNSNSRPLPPLVLADWGEVMVLYHELAAKPEFACAVYGAAFTHDPDLIYSDRTMETFEMAALMAGKAEVPFFGMPADQHLREAREQRERARPLPQMFNGYPTVVYYPVTDPHGSEVVVGPVVLAPKPARVNEAESQWEAILLSSSLSGKLAEPDADLKFFTAAAVESLKIKWRDMSYEDRVRLDKFSMKIQGSKVSDELQLELGIDPEV